jgi:hypothetical protein
LFHGGSSIRERGAEGKGVSVFNEAFHHQLDNLLNVLEGFLLGVAPGGGALLDEGGTISVPAVLLLVREISYSL